MYQPFPSNKHNKSFPLVDETGNLREKSAILVSQANISRNNHPVFFNHKSKTLDNQQVLSSFESYNISPYFRPFKYLAQPIKIVNSSFIYNQGMNSAMETEKPTEKDLI
jgi:hypothetical protein